MGWRRFCLYFSRISATQSFRGDGLVHCQNSQVHFGAASLISIRLILTFLVNYTSFSMTCTKNMVNIQSASGGGSVWGWILKSIGPIVRYRPNLLIVSDPTMLPVIYHRYADKTNYYLQAVGATTAFTCLKHKDHTNARRRISGPVRKITKSWIESNH